MQFDRVEGAGPPAPPACAQCRRPLDEYFSVGGQHMFCRTCVDGLRNSASFWQSLLYGAGAALLGSIVWFAILKLFNYELGLIGIVVGLFVGFAVRKGARGLGGGKFQALAMALTYLSITGSYVPLVLKGMVEAAEKKDEAGGDEAANDQAADPTNPAKAPAPGAAPAAKKAPDQVSAGALVLAFAMVFAISLASPFLSGADNFMGWIIIGIALYEAWKINRRMPITGPLRFGPGLSVPAPAPVTPPGMPPPAAAT